ncbi:hypothetical protein LXM94_16550 [Rhizobium sp. TRM95111]|uniref:hypothetical protein n=1 Tax=Rhizobium alarense TaxID=2846851 RepID=UPI001F2EDE3B|nr:hypothetical protein [Rhizobium alarense]MCF3641584.1 hypothetical protein [Rhizobium alarense]
MASRSDYRRLRQIEHIRHLRQLRLQNRLATLRQDAELLDKEKQEFLARRQALGKDEAGSAVASMLHTGHQVAGRALHSTARRRQSLTVAVAKVDEQLSALRNQEMRILKRIDECEVELAATQRRMLRLQELAQLVSRQLRQRFKA